MWTVLFTTELDDRDLLKRIEDEDDDFDIGEVLDVTKDITYDIIYSKFLEDPEEYLYCLIVTDADKKTELNYSAALDEPFYDKHIGKLIKEAKRKLIREIITEFVLKMEDIDWKTV